MIAYGLADLPAEQSRRPAALDLAEGRNLLAVGAAQSGRTTLLRTIAAGIARDHSPADVHLYVLDLTRAGWRRCPACRIAGRWYGGQSGSGPRGCWTG